MQRAAADKVDEHWKSLKDRFGIDHGLDYRDRLKYEAFEFPENERAKVMKDIDNDSDNDLNNDDLKVKLDEIVYDVRLKSRGYFYAKIDTPFYQK